MITKRIIKYSSVVVILFHILLIFDGLPLLQTIFSISTICWCSLLWKRFPVIEIISPVFIVACSKLYLLIIIPISIISSCCF